MKLKPIKRVPAIIACTVVALVCIERWIELRFPEWDFGTRAEWITYDKRVRAALGSAPEVATNLGFVFMDEATIKFVLQDKDDGFGFGLYWPRQVYARVVQELDAQQANTIAFDVMFPDLRSDQPKVTTLDGKELDSDQFLAEQMRQSGKVILATTDEIYLPTLFRDNARAVADISTDKDPDGILRRAKAFKIYRRWHLAFRQTEYEVGLDLRKASVEPGRIVLPYRDSGSSLGSASNLPPPIVIPVDKNGDFDLMDFVGDKLPPGMARRAKPFTDQLVWHMGVTLAARALNLDLDHAERDLEHGRIVLRGPGVERIIPVDHEGSFYIDWCLPPEGLYSDRITKESIRSLLEQNIKRWKGETDGLTNRWRNKLPVVGSIAVGNDLTDRGATPLGKDTALVSKHWNVANSIITGHFVQRAPLWLEFSLIVLLGLVAAMLTWELRVVVSLAFLLPLFIAYIVLSVVLYVHSRYWLPLVYPLGGGLLTTYTCLMVWRAIFEQAERRRVRSVFSKMVSPKIVTELLEAEELELGGKRREITVFFADVRGFTEFTDRMQKRVDEFVKKNKLSGRDAEICHDKQAEETLTTVNTYLGVIADVIKKQDGTLDKFIGDCVMAFWGAPTPNPKHAQACVRAAIEAQRAVDKLNQSRAETNKLREIENRARAAAGQAEEPPLAVLTLGTGINTGIATAGLMGSAAEKDESLSYTVFGREVNLASRLEGASGRGHIYISETTYQHLLRDDPALAATCTEVLERKILKGFDADIKMYEVPWQIKETAEIPAQPAAAAAVPQTARGAE